MNEDQNKLHTAEESLIEYTHEIHNLNNYIEGIMDAAFSYAILLDGDGKILYYSDSLITLAGITDKNKFIGMHIVEVYNKLFFNRDLVNDASRRLSRIMSGENKFYEDDIVTWPNGEKLIYRINYKRIADENRGFIGIFIFALDITEIRLEEANQRLNDLLYSTTLPCLIWDESGNIIEYNTEAVSAFHAPENLSSEEFNDFFLSIEPEYQPSGNKTELIRHNALQEALEKGFSQVAVRLEKGDGAPLWFMINVTRITWMFGYRLVVYYYDQTDKMIKESETRKAENRMKLMLDAAPLGCLLIEDNFDVIDCNYELMSILDIPYKKVIMDDFFRFSPEFQPDGRPSREKAAEYMGKAHKTKSMTFEWMHRDYNGEPVPAEVTLAWIKHGEDSAIVCYLRDLREYKKMIAETNEANEHMQFMFNSMPITTNQFNMDLKVVDCNDECIKLFGINSKEEYIERFYDLAPEYQPNGMLSKDVSHKAIEKAFEEGYARIEFTHQNISGELIPCEVILIRMKYKDEMYVLGYAWDMRETKAALAEVNEANERIQLMLENNPLICMMRDDQDNIIDCNQAALNILGVPDKEEFCREFNNFFPEFQPDGSRSADKIKEILKFADQEGSIRYERTLRSRTGELIPTETKVIRIPWKGTYYYLSFSHDLRELKRLAKDEEESRNMMNKAVAILENVETLISITDLDYNLIYMNQNMASAFGVNRDFCTGKKCYQAIRNRDEPCSICKLPRLLPDKESLPSQFDEYMWDDVLNIWTESNTSIIHWVDDSLVYFHSINDRSVKKAYEDELRKAMDDSIAESASKTTFLANMSHEIRTPMNSIIGFAELALDSDISPKTEDYLNKIMDSAEWLLHVINDILDISKIETGKMELEYIPFELHSIISRCESVVLPFVKEKSLDLKVNAEPMNEKKLLGDPVRLYQVLLNLLANAVKFTSAGTVSFSSVIKNSDEKTMTLCFEIKDSGIGMTTDQINRIYEPFMQADVSTTRIYGGTGLGLPITKNLVELMGSKLEVESNPGTGSTFRFEVTFETIDATDDMLEYGKISVVKKPHFQGLILVCEDNQMNQQVICEHLTRVGLQTVIAENGKIGVDMVQERIKKEQKPFDMIFMDMFMPVMNGIEAASKISALGTGTPIVAMTANVMTSELDNYKKNGMSYHVGKPFTSQELWRCLLKYLKPIGISAVDTSDRAQDDNLLTDLKISFVKNNQNKYDELAEAIQSNDLILAHRLVHTLKSNAGLIGKSDLRNVAAEAEALLKDGIIPNANRMGSIERELNSVLEELKPLLDEPAGQPGHEMMNPDQILALLTKLEPMLKSRNTECLTLLDDIRSVPGAEELACQIEKYDFKPAIRTLAELIEKWL